MFMADLLTALIIATLILLPFYFMGRLGTWSGYLWFTLVLFLFTWAGGVWVGPFGPTLWGFSWLPFLFFGLLFAFFMAAATPGRPPRNRQEAIAQRQAAKETETMTRSWPWVSISGFCWQGLSWRLSFITCDRKIMLEVSETPNLKKRYEKKLDSFLIVQYIS